MSEEHTYQTYVSMGVARFHIPEGAYSIEELEDLLRKLKDIREMQSAHLMRSMQPLNPKDKKCS